MAEDTTAPEATATETVDAPVESAPVASSVTLSNEQFAQLLAAATAPREAAPVVEEPVVEEGPKTYTQEEIDAEPAPKLSRWLRTRHWRLHALAGIIPRQGLVGGQTAGQFAAPVANTKAPSLKELSEMSEDDYFTNTYEALETHPGWSRLMRSADMRARGW